MTKLHDLNEIRELSAKMLEDERKGAHLRQETTPATISPRLADFCASLSSSNARFVPVVGDPNGFYGFCSDGVAEKVKLDGGGPVFGWNIWEWPNVLWTAEFHAIWAAPDGELKDITPKPGGERSILFVPDDRYRSDFDFDNRPGNRRCRAYEPRDKHHAILESIGGMALGQRRYEERRAEKQDMTVEDWLASKMPEDTLAPLIDALIRACDEHEDYFDSLGVSGEIEIDDTFRHLLLRRLTCQQKLKAALEKRPKT